MSDTPFGFEFHLGKPIPDADFCFMAQPCPDVARHFIREGVRAEQGSPAAALAAGLQCRNRPRTRIRTSPAPWSA